MTEEEEYYDSIDDTEFEECRSFCNDKFADDDSEVEEDVCSKMRELIPFYTGNVDKSEIDSIKNDSKTNSISALRNGKLQRRKPSTSLNDRRKNRSYLTMFYAKHGYQLKPDNAETNRATCTELTPKSDMPNNEDKISCFESANSESVYSRFLEKEDNRKGQIAYNYESESTLSNKLLSVSEARFTSLMSTRQCSKREVFRGKCNTRSLKMGELGGLGPNLVTEKLESLRRRQDYGKTVSQKNRIKITENKLVQKLKQEIRESNKY